MTRTTTSTPPNSLLLYIHSLSFDLELEEDSLDAEGRRPDGTLVFTHTTEFTSRLQARLTEKVQPIYLHLSCLFVHLIFLPGSLSLKACLSFFISLYMSLSLLSLSPSFSRPLFLYLTISLFVFLGISLLMFIFSYFLLRINVLSSL